MKPKMLVAVALIVLGIASLAYQGFTYTTNKNVVDLGPLKATVKEEKTIPLPPILGIIALAGGIAILALDRRGQGA